MTRSALRWGERNGRWRRVDQGIWAQGWEDPSDFDRARGAVMATGGVASHHVAGVLHGLGSVALDGTWLTLPPAGAGGAPEPVAGGCHRSGS